MSAAEDDHTSATEDVSAEQTPAASAETSPAETPSESSTVGGAASSSSEMGSGLLEKIQALSNTQKALKEQKKKCATEMRNAMKRKRRMQGKASQLSDADLLEVLRLRKAKKETEKPGKGPPKPK